MDKLRVRAYNVQFGDAILVSFPELIPEGGEETRHMLIDVGNVLFKSKGGEDDVFEPVFEDILKELDGTPLDLYIMSHEHLDHVQGLRYAESKLYTGGEDEFKEKLRPRYAWLTKSSEPGYYDDHKDARVKHLQLRGVYDQIDGYMNALSASGEELNPIAQALWLNNNYRKTQDCVDYIADVAEQTCYVHRGFDTGGHSPFTEAKMEIWGPEENTAEYYSSFRPTMMDLGVMPASEGEPPTLTEPEPPPGVYTGAFYDLLNMRKGYVDNLLAIDKAANNTSVVLALEWRGNRLLFTGDAEEKSWKIMERHDALKPVDFLKVSHHASVNGTPSPEILRNLLRHEGEKIRSGLVCTWEGTYSGVPDEATLQKLADHCQNLHNLHEEKETGKYIDIFFEPVEEKEGV